VLDLLEPLGLRARFAIFQHQPEWRERPLHQQLRRFAGTSSGRKALFAGALAGELAPHEVPAPLLHLVTRIAEAPSSSDVSARNG
jgi:hypothetical protein